MRVSAFIKSSLGSPAIRLKINAPDARVDDYLIALNKLISDGGFQREFNPAAADCHGCDLCCQEPIPVTSVDLVQINKGLKENLALPELVKKYCHVAVKGPVVDITLKRDRRGRCIFLANKEKICRIYSFRPLVCQTFICVEQHHDAAELRSRIVNQGEDELVRAWLLEHHQTGRQFHFDEAFRPKLNLADWGVTPYTGCNSYQEVMLKDLCSVALWRRLYTGEKFL